MKVPSDFYTADPTSTKDIKPISEEHRVAWEKHFDQTLKKMGKLQIRNAKSFQKAKAFWNFQAS